MAVDVYWRGCGGCCASVLKQTAKVRIEGADDNDDEMATGYAAKHVYCDGSAWLGNEG